MGYAVSFALLTIALLATPTHAQTPVGRTPGALFPEPFVVEHQIVQADGDGSVFHAEPVTDYYGGSWIVSVRPDDSRVVIDLARGEITEVRPERGAYWTLSFGRLAELRQRLARAEGGSTPEPDFATKAEEEPRLVVRETSDPRPATVDRVPDLEKSVSTVLAKPGVRHLRVTLEKAAPDDPTLDVWVDPAFRLTPAARAALARLEGSALGGAKNGKTVPVSKLLAAAREEAGGAFPVRTVRPFSFRDGEARGAIEDRTTRLERLESFPLELVEVPDGLRRVPHPLESMVAFAEQEAEVREQMGGGAPRRPEEP